MAETLFNTINKKETSLADQVAGKINQLIIDKNLKPGDRLPSEFELAEALNVGRGTIREAVKKLVARNCLEIRRGKGTFVTEHVGEVDDPLGLTYVSDQKKLGLDLSEIRLRMEPWFAQLAAERATEEDLVKLKETCQKVEDDISAHVNHLDHDLEFHTAIAACSHNQVASKLIPIISKGIFSSGEYSNMKYGKETIQVHRAITDAICSRDPEQAYKAMEEHLRGNKSIWEE